MDKPVILKVNDLHVSFSGAHGEVKAVRGISYELHEGEVLGIVGESGSGKSASAYAIMGLLRGTGRVTGGTIEYRGTNILENSRSQWEALRGKRIGMIFQNPMASPDILGASAGAGFGAALGILMGLSGFLVKWRYFSL